jgi:hypothetical protein
VASCDLRLHVGLHFNEKLRHLWHSEQEQHLTSVAAKGQENCGTQNQSNVEQKQENTDHTRQASSGQGQEKTKKRRLGALKLHPKRAQSSFRGASKVPSTAQVPLEASRAASERSRGGSWDIPGRPRERLGELRGRRPFPEYFGPPRKRLEQK